MKTKKRKEGERKDLWVIYVEDFTTCCWVGVGVESFGVAGHGLAYEGGGCERGESCKESEGGCELHGGGGRGRLVLELR